MSGDIGVDDSQHHDSERILRGFAQASSHYEQLEQEIKTLRESVSYLLVKVETLDSYSELLADNVRILKEKNSSLSAELDRLKAVTSGGVNKTTQRAYLLADSVKAAHSGFITRSQARSILTEGGIKPHPKITRDAMQAAADLFGFVLDKNQSGKIILRVK
jgi:FtsZ-binding cell division protein ZapB